MNLDFTDAELEFQAEARAWLEANVPAVHASGPLPSMDTAEGFVAHQEWERKLADARWSVVSWPEEFGGRDASLVEWVIFEEEYYRAGAPGRVSQNGIFLLAPILFDHGTADQQARFLPSMGTGEVIWAQAWSDRDAALALLARPNLSDADRARAAELSRKADDDLRRVRNELRDFLLAQGIATQDIVDRASD
jgi:alkylation response protein AidB-like acyl-CoA dehydrogenase